MLVISLVYCACIYWLYVRAKKRRQTHDVNVVLDLCMIIMVAGFIGARATHIFYEAFDYYKTDWLAALKLWQGGFVFYGGFLAALGSSILYLRHKKQNFYLWADFFAPVLALGYALGRLGCFFSGCCYGRICSGSACDLPWMMHLGHGPLSEGLRHPTQLYATAWELCVFLFLIYTERKKMGTPSTNAKPSKISWPAKTWLNYMKSAPLGTLFLTWLILHATGRIVMEAFRDDSRGPTVAGMSLGTLVSIAIILVAGSLAIRRSNRAIHTP